jgi:hypothetical protein
MAMRQRVHIKKHLSFSAIRKALSALFETIDDPRQAGKVDYSLHDCLMSILAMMFFQDPSVLSFQRRMQDRMQDNNLKAIFAVARIPSDSALRQSLDNIPTAAIESAFPMLLKTPAAGQAVGRLQAGKRTPLDRLGWLAIFYLREDPLSQLPDLQRRKRSNPLFTPDFTGRDAQSAPAPGPAPGTRADRQH